MTSLAALDRLVTDLCLEFQSAGPFERHLFIPTPAALAGLSRRSETLRDEVAATAEDLIWKEHLLEVLDLLQFRLEEDQRFPYRFLGHVVGTVNSLTSMDSRPVAKRAAILAEKLPQTADLFPVVLEMLGRLPADRLDQVREYAVALQQVLAGAEPVVAAWGRSDLVPVLQATAAAARRFVDALAAGIRRNELLQDFPFDMTLTRGYGVDLADLLSWYETEIARREAELTELAARIQPGKSPHAILDEELPAYPDPAMMFAPMREYVEIARKASLRYITLPQGESCDVADVPEQLKRSYPWGGFSGGNPLQGSLLGKVFLNSANYKAVTKGWLQMMAIHECYPGHHAHFVKTAAAEIPDSYKLGSLRMSKSTPLIEGGAHRSEELFQDLFPDRAFPLFIKLRQLHTAVRIKAEISMHHLGRPRDEAVDLYVKHLGFSRQSADGQVRYGEIWPGYFCCYYYGHKRLEELKARYRMPEPQFTELTFSSGFVSLETVERLLAERVGQ